MQKNLDPGTVKKKWLAFVVVAAAFTSVADGIFKYLTLQLPPEQGSFVSNRIFQIALHKNYGIAFGLPLNRWLIITMTLLVLGVFVFLIWKNYNTRPVVSAALSVTSLGALGNLFDRLAHGFTVDYLIFFARSAVNLSDVLIVLGIIWLLIASRKPTISADS